MRGFGVHRRKPQIDPADERAQAELREWRRKRFRILVCVNGSDESYEGLRFAAQIGRNDECDIILAFVRPIDQGMRTGGLQVRVARENMLEWGLELPGVRYLKKGLDILVDEGYMDDGWDATTAHTDTWGDPLGDNKIEYRHESGKSVVLKLKTAPDAASGILDQYELGPYNLMILGKPSRWQGEFTSWWHAGVTQKIAMLSPCSVLVARPRLNGNGKGHLICTDGTARSFDAVRRDAVLAKFSRSPITLFGVALDPDDKARAEETVSQARQMIENMGIKVEDTLVGVGDPTEQIIEAGSDHSLIAVSDSGKSRLKRFLVGSVAFNVMGRATISVLNVR